MNGRVLALVLLGGVVMAIGASRPGADPDVAVTIIPQVRHQMILGWG